MQAVLNFMYHGEVNVAQEALNSFLSVADDLQVKGLTQNKSSESSTQHQQPEKASINHQKQLQQQSSNSEHLIRRQCINNYKSSPHQDGDVQEVEVQEIKKEPQTPTPTIPQVHMADPLTQQHIDTVTTLTDSHNTGLEMAMSATTDESFMEEEYDNGQYDLQAEAEGMTGYPDQEIGPTQGMISGIDMFFLYKLIYWHECAALQSVSIRTVDLQRR